MYGPKTSDPIREDYSDSDSDSDSIDPRLGYSGPIVQTPYNPAPKWTHPGFPFPRLGNSGLGFRFFNWGLRIPDLSGRFGLRNIFG